jgi:hypothetical protein
LSLNHITYKGVEYFVTKSWTNLLKLHLAANNIGPKGALALANTTFPKLIKLQIYDCHLGN